MGWILFTLLLGFVLGFMVSVAAAGRILHSKGYTGYDDVPKKEDTK